jgi:Flp pilus assembly protein TadD
MPPITNATSKLDQAISLHQSAQLAEAETLYREIIDETDSLPDACHNLAVLLLYKDTITAVNLFRTALEASPEQAQYWLSYIEALIISGQFESAKEVLEVAENCGLEGRQSDRIRSMLSAENAPAPAPHEINQLGTLFSSGHNFDTEEAARTLTLKYPNHGTGWKALGASLARQAKWEMALPILAKATELLPADAEAHFNLGLACQQNSDFIKAESSYLRALTIKIDYLEVYNNLGLLYETQGDNTAAILVFKKDLTIEPEHAQTHNNLALSLHHFRNFGEAINHFNQAIRTQPQYAEAYNNLGASLQSIGALAEAEAAVRKSIAISPFCASAYNNLGNILQETGKFDESEQMLRKALEINPELPDAFNNLGNLYQGRKKFKEACFYYHRAVELKPHDPLSLNNIGTATQSLGEFHEAISWYKKALEADPSYHNAHSNLLFALNYLSERKPEEDLALAVKYGKSVATTASRYDHWKCNPAPGRLRVGIVSGDMLSHPVGYFLENAIKELASDRIELIAYSSHYQKKHKKTTVDPAALTARLLKKAPHQGPIHIQRTIATGRLHRSNGGQLALLAVERHQLCHVHIRDTIPVGKAEIITIQKRTYTLQAAPGHGFFTGIHQRHLPRLGVVLVNLHAVMRHVERHIRHVQEVVGEIFLDDITLVAQADDEFIDTMGRVGFEYVPEYRLAADLHHGLGLDLGFFAQARPQPPCKNHCFHF